MPAHRCKNLPVQCARVKNFYCEVLRYWSGLATVVTDRQRDSLLMHEDEDISKGGEEADRHHLWCAYARSFVYLSVYLTVYRMASMKNSCGK